MKCLIYDWCMGNCDHALIIIKAACLGFVMYCNVMDVMKCGCNGRCEGNGDNQEPQAAVAR